MYKKSTLLWVDINGIQKILHLDHNNNIKLTHWAMSAMASSAAHGFQASIPVQLSSLPHHRQCQTHSVHCSLYWGWLMSPFLLSHFKANFCQIMGMTNMASTITHGSLASIPLHYTCSPQYLQFWVLWVGSVLCYGVAWGATKVAHKKNEGWGPGLAWAPID